jgi:L-ribulose-5-phosphate 4-epimerase
MNLQDLREQVLEANLELVRQKLVVFTFGNASGFDPDSGLVVIKPSGVPYEELKPAQLVVTDLNGKIVEGTLRPSSDLPTHVALYRTFKGIRGVVHTHSRYATSWAQAGVEIPCFGTTHADYFRGAIPVTPSMQPAEIQSEYEWNTGQVIIRRFKGLDPINTTAVLVSGHAPFCWGVSPRGGSYRCRRRRTRTHGLFDDNHPSRRGCDFGNSSRQTLSSQAWPRRLLRTTGKNALAG